jgi:hypothetical protein
MNIQSHRVLKELSMLTVTLQTFPFLAEVAKYGKHCNMLTQHRQMNRNQNLMGMR